MDVKELTDLLVTSSQRINQSQFIPWWEDDFENCTYRYDIIPQKTVDSANTCLAACPKEALLAPAGSYGLTLFHLLVWHNFYDSVKAMVDDGRIGREEINLPDCKGHGLTPFLLACCRGNLAMVKLFLECGADESLCDQRGMSPYHFLVYPRFEDLVNTCMDKGIAERAAIARLLTCDINQKDQEGLTPLVRMLSSSYVSHYTWPMAEIFLEKGADTGYVDDNGNTLLMMAMRNNHMTAALLLMKHHKEMVNVPNKEGVTPIAHAADWRNDGLCLALADHGAVLTADTASIKAMDLERLSQITSNAFGMVSEDNKDGLRLALYLTEKLIGQVDMDDDDELGYVEEILHNALVSDKEFHVLDACQAAGLDFTMPIHFRGSITCLRDQCLGTGYGTDAVKKMWNLGVDMDKAVIGGRTPANLIASMEKGTGSFFGDRGFFEEVPKLLSKESMEQTDNNGIAAVHMAARMGHTDMLAVMIEKGVDVNLTEDAPAQAGMTPLHEACLQGHGEVVKLLVEAGADDSLKTINGETPAHCAVTKKRFGREPKSEQRAQILGALKHLDIPREDGKTPLMLLQSLDSAALTELLPMFLDRGADVNHKDNDGMSVLLLHADHGCEKDMVKLLLKAGADINAADNEGNTALHYTLQNGDPGTARFLIKKGADYNRPNNQGITPVQIAVEKGFDTVLELMTDMT